MCIPSLRKVKQQQHTCIRTQSEKQEVTDETIDGVEERRSDAMGKMYVVRSFVVHRYTVHDTSSSYHMWM